MSAPPVEPIIHVVGWLLVGEAAAMTIPAMADALVGSPDWIAFILSAFVTAGVGGALVLASGGARPTSLSVRQTFLLTTLAWAALSAFAAIPFVLSSTDLGLVDALYEATSGLTTAGGTVIVGLDQLPPGPLLWRILLNWFGGIGLVAMTLLVFPFLRVGGMQLFRTESSDRSDKLFGRASDLAATIATVYVAITTLSAKGSTWQACPGSTPLPTACRRSRPGASRPGMPPLQLSPGSHTTGSPPFP